VSGVVVGSVVWAVIAAAVVVWVVATQTAGAGTLPGAATVARWFLQCWLGRVLLVVAWGEIGWHVFCQRP
jgi:hypothetical protein